MVQQRCLVPGAVCVKEASGGFIISRRYMYVDLSGRSKRGDGYCGVVFVVWTI